MDIRERVEKEFLTQVIRPARYLGNEYNSIHKDLSQVKIRIALCCPLLYEQGIADIGFEILYYTLNSFPCIWAERFFTMSPDAENLLNEKDIPIFSLESKSPLNEFHIIAFTIRSELVYLDILTMLSLGQLPLYSSERNDDFPFIVGGGISKWNPEPIANFLDGLIIGNWEAGLYNLLQKLVDLEKPKIKRSDIQKISSEISGFYFPSHYKTIYNSFNEFQELRRINSSAPDLIETTDMSSIKAKHFSINPIFPIISMDYKFNSVYNLKFDFNKQFEGKFLELSTQGKNWFWEITKEKAFLDNREIEFLFPEFRFEPLPSASFDFKDFQVEKTFCIFAGAGSQRLRALINNFYRDDDLFRLINYLLQTGWRKIQLKFIIGLPSEKEEDIIAIPELVKKALMLFEHTFDFQLSVFITFFSPEPFSFLQWDGIEKEPILHKKIEKLKQDFDLPKIKLFFENPEKSFVKTILNRGDRSIADVIKKTWESGTRLNSFDDSINWASWKTGFETSGKSWQQLISPLSVTIPLPWDHFETGVSKPTLKSQRLKAYKNQLNAERENHVCFGNRLTREEFEKLFKSNIIPATEKISENHFEDDSYQPVQYGRKKKKGNISIAPVRKKIRIRYAKTGNARFYSHLDIARIFELTAKRALIQIIYSQGKKPHPKMSFGPPLPVGISSTAEYLDMDIMVDQGLNFQDQLNQFLPEGIRVLQFKILFAKVPSLSAILNRSDYDIYLTENTIKGNQINEWLEKSEIWIERTVNEDIHKVNIRPHVANMVLEKNKLTVSTRSVNGRNARVNEILGTIFDSQEMDWNQFLVQRIGQFEELGSQILSPFEEV